MANQTSQKTATHTYPLKDRRQTHGRRVSDHIIHRINEASINFLVPLTPEETYKAVVHEAIEIIGAWFGSIIMPNRGRLDRVYSSSPLGFQIKNRKTGNAYKAYKESRVIVANFSDWGKEQPQAVKLGIKSVVFIPLSYKSKSIGVLSLTSKEYFDDSDEVLNALKLYGSMASLAIRKAQLYAEAQHALDTRDLFISLAAHELRTPLTTIHVYLDLLKKRLLKTSEGENYRRWLDIMTSESGRLGSLINELLVVNRIKAGKLTYNFQENNINDILELAVVNFRLNNPGRKLEYKKLPKNAPKLLIADSDKILQAIINLLNNAAKFSHDDSTVYLDLSFDSPNFVINITDLGQGINKDDLPRIFEGFYKGHGNEKEGMGLGLFLAREVIRKHRGKLSVKSQVGVGTTFTIILRSEKIGGKNGKTRT